MQVMNDSFEENIHNRSCDDVPSKQSEEEDQSDNCCNRSFVLFEKLKYAKNSKLLYIYLM
jgi:hypothetical protein